MVTVPIPAGLSCGFVYAPDISSVVVSSQANARLALMSALKKAGVMISFADLRANATSQSESAMTLHVRDSVFILCLFSSPRNNSSADCSEH